MTALDANARSAAPAGRPATATRTAGPVPYLRHQGRGARIPVPHQRRHPARRLHRPDRTAPKVLRLGRTWWATTPKLRPATRRGYWQLLDGHVVPYFGARSMGGIDHLDVEQFIAAKLVEGLSPKKVRDAVSVVSLVMKCAVRANARKDNPAADHQIRVARQKLRPGDVPDMADIERLVAHVADPYKPAVWLLAYTGMRPSELCGLRVSSIDFVRRVIRVTETLMPVYRYRNGGTSWWRVRPRPRPATETYPSRHGCAISWPPCSPLEPRSGGRSGPRRLPVRAANRDTPSSGQIPPEGGPSRPSGRRVARDSAHLRHAPLSRQPAHRPRRQPVAISQRMGHSDPAVTLRVYGHLFAGVQEDLTRRLDDLRRARWQDTCDWRR